eukprot:3151748-Amphidinium_carterae.1
MILIVCSFAGVKLSIVLARTSRVRSSALSEQVLRLNAGSTDAGKTIIRYDAANVIGWLRQ